MSQILDESAAGEHHLHWLGFMHLSSIPHPHAHHAATVLSPNADEEQLPHQLHLEPEYIEVARMSREMKHL